MLNSTHGVLAIPAFGLLLSLGESFIVKEWLFVSFRGVQVRDGQRTTNVFNCT